MILNNYGELKEYLTIDKTEDVEIDFGVSPDEPHFFYIEKLLEKQYTIKKNKERYNVIFRKEIKINSDISLLLGSNKAFPQSRFYFVTFDQVQFYKRKNTQNPELYGLTGFENCIFKNRLGINTDNFSNDVTFASTDFGPHAHFYNEASIKQGNKSVAIYNSKGTNLEIRGHHNAIKNNIDLKTGCRLHCVNFENVTFSFVSNYNDITIFQDDENSSINNLKFINSDLNNRISLNGKGINNLLFENITSYGNLVELRDLDLDTLVVRNSDLGNIKFNGVRIGRLTIENATLNDCIFNGIEFLDYELGNQEGKISTSKLKDNYRQLKHVMDKNGNHTEANKFYALEMGEYSKLIKLDGKGFWDIVDNLHKSKYSGEVSHNLGELISLKFSQNVNNFGNNWIRPAFLILFIAYLSTMIIGLTKLSSDLIVFLSFILLILLDYLKPRYLNNTNHILDKFIDHIFGFLLFIAFTFFLFDISIPGFNSLTIFSNLLNPVYILPQFGIFEGERLPLVYNSLELLAFVFYKILYGILLWHLIVAAKRTTRR